MTTNLTKQRAEIVDQMNIDFNYIYKLTRVKYAELNLGDFDEFGDELEEKIYQALDSYGALVEQETREAALNEGYMASLSDCVDLTACSECKDHLAQLRSSQPTDSMTMQDLLDDWHKSYDPKVKRGIELMKKLEKKEIVKHSADESNKMQLETLASQPTEEENGL